MPQEKCKKDCLEHKYHCGTCNRPLGYSPANYFSRPQDIPNICEYCFGKQEVIFHTPEKEEPSWIKKWKERFCVDHIVLNDQEQIDFISNLLIEEKERLIEEITKLFIEFCPYCGQKLKPYKGSKYSFTCDCEKGKKIVISKG